MRALCSLAPAARSHQLAPGWSTGCINTDTRHSQGAYDSESSWHADDVETLKPTKTFPSITAVTWLPAREVLGGEATDFTPWLRQESSLEILGTGLRLDELTAVAAEHNVLGKRLDILARALDENGEEVPVCIENQYGMSDADHLGRLIAYLAQHERGRAVWVVEHAHDAFVAGVRFLNRTSTEDVGYYLVQVRFTHGVDGGYQVHFEVLAAPIAWEGPGRRGTPSAVNHPKVKYLEAVHQLVRPALLAAGFPSLNTHARGNYLWIRWPADLWIRRFSRRLDIRVTKDLAMVAVYITAFATQEANGVAAEILRERYSLGLASALPEGTSVNWDVVGFGQRKAIRLERPGGGYLVGDAEQVAVWSAACCTSVLELLRREPSDDLEEQVVERMPGSTISDSQEDELDGDAE